MKDRLNPANSIYVVVEEIRQRGTTFLYACLFSSLDNCFFAYYLLTSFELAYLINFLLVYLLYSLAYSFTSLLYYLFTSLHAFLLPLLASLIFVCFLVYVFDNKVILPFTSCPRVGGYGCQFSPANMELGLTLSITTRFFCC